MKPEQLSSLLESLTGKKDNKPQLKAIAHWMRKVKESKGEYIHTEGELPMLEKLVHLGLIKMSKESHNIVNVELTGSGKELHDSLALAGII